jgi:hypothetical protein
LRLEFGRLTLARMDDSLGQQRAIADTPATASHFGLTLLESTYFCATSKCLFANFRNSRVNAHEPFLVVTSLCLIAELRNSRDKAMPAVLEGPFNGSYAEFRNSRDKALRAVHQYRRHLYGSLAGDVQSAFLLVILNITAEQG